MSGTPEKILEHLLETIKLDSNGNDAIGGHVCGGLAPGGLAPTAGSLTVFAVVMFPCRCLRERLSAHPQSFHVLQSAVLCTPAPISWQPLVNSR